jgi:hypothetical protein
MVVNAIDGQGASRGTRNAQEDAMKFKAMILRAATGLGFLIPLTAASTVVAGVVADEGTAVSGAPGEDHVDSATKDAAQFFPATQAPNSSSARAVGMGWAGYDSAARTPLVSAMVAARLGTRLVLAATAINSSTSSTVRPGVSARVQLLDQRRQGVDAGLSLGYRRDLFSAEGGFFQTVVSVGRRFGETNLIANLAYGQDGEGDDRDGEARLAGLRPVVAGLQLGLDGRMSHSIASTDPNRQLHGTPSMTYTAGVLAAYALGPWALMLETGITGRRTDHLDTGFVTLGGAGAVF